MSQENRGWLRVPRVPRRLAVLTAVVAGMLGLGSGVASAAVIDQVRYHDTGSEVVDWCEGIPIETSWDVTGSYRGVSVGPDGLVHYGDSQRGTQRFVNLNTGRAYTTIWASASRDLKVTDNGDGTLTILIQGSGSERWYDGNGKLVLRNPGMLRYEILVDTNGTPADPFDDQFLDFLGVVKPSTGLNELDGRDFCTDVALFTS